MAEDAAWAGFDRLVTLFESAHIELECRRVTGRRLGDAVTEAARQEYSRRLRDQAVFRNDAWRMAIAASAKPQSSSHAVTDLRDTVCDTLRYRLQLR